LNNYVIVWYYVIFVHPINVIGMVLIKMRGWWFCNSTFDVDGVL
jgi:hypothetical protein